MGSIFQDIFGGSSNESQQSSNSYNRAYDTISSGLSPLLGYAGQGAKGITDFLGGDTSGFDRFKRMTGFDQTADYGSRGITGNAAASGLLRSGSTNKGLANYGAMINNQFANNYLDRLMGQAGIGFNAANALSSAGNVSNSQGSSSGSQSSGNFGKTLFAAASLFSDPKLKMDVTELGTLPNGLGVYEFYYIDGSGPFIGVMADEVEQIQPEALGPVVDGFMTVDYSKIGGLDEFQRLY